MGMIMLRGCCSSLFAGIVAYCALIAVHAAFADEDPPTPVATLKITWQAPTTLENGEPLPQNDIEAYDLYYSLDGAQRQYVAWISNNPKTTEYEHSVAAYGRYCYRLRTLATLHGKSLLSDAVCIDVVAPVFPPLPPHEIDIKQKREGD